MECGTNVLGLRSNVSPMRSLHRLNSPAAQSLSRSIFDDAGVLNEATSKAKYRKITELVDLLSTEAGKNTIPGATSDTWLRLSSGDEAWNMEALSTLFPVNGRSSQNHERSGHSMRIDVMAKQRVPRGRIPNVRNAD